MRNAIVVLGALTLGAALIGPGASAAAEDAAGTLPVRWEELTAPDFVAGRRARLRHGDRAARDHREARSPPAARDGSARRARARDARGEAGVRRRLPALLLRADLRGEAPARDRRVQREADLGRAAGDGRRDRPQRDQEDHPGERSRREQQLPSVLLPVAARASQGLRHLPLPAPRRRCGRAPRSRSCARRRWTCTPERSRPRRCSRTDRTSCTRSARACSRGPTRPGSRCPTPTRRSGGTPGSRITTPGTAGPRIASWARR